MRHVLAALSLCLAAIAAPASAENWCPDTRPDCLVAAAAPAKPHRVARPRAHAIKRPAPAALAGVPLPRPRPIGLADPAAVPAPIALVAEAVRWVGAGARDLGVRRSLWCAAAINKFLANLGLPGTGSEFAESFATYGVPADGPRPGVIAVKRRYRGGRLVGGHVVIVKAIDARGRIVAISPNSSGGRVRVTTYPASAFYAYRVPGA